MYDLTKRSTFDNLQFWIKELKANAEPDIVIIIIGNKLDLCQEDNDLRKVTTEEGEHFAKRQKAPFMETSAIKNINVEIAFKNLMQGID